MSEKRKLITLLPSTDCDLGRWLLKHYGIDYVESPHAPVMHVLALKYYGFDKNSYPLLLEPDGTGVPTIPKILRKYESEAPPGLKLLPDDPSLASRVRKAGDDYRIDMGNGVVFWAYWNFLPHKWLNWSSFTTGVPWYEKLFVLFGYSLLKGAMIKGLALNQAKADAGLQSVLKYFDEVDAKLADGREFLFADRLTYADLAFAANAAPMILADGYGGHLPPVEDCPMHMQEVMLELRYRPAGKFAQQIYERYRLGFPIPPAKVIPLSQAAD